MHGTWYATSQAHLRRNSGRYEFAALGLLVFGFTLFGLSRISANTSAEPTIGWQSLYKPSNFTRWSDVVDYLKELRTGITPLWSAIEVISYRLHGNADFLLKTVYQLSIIGSFLLAIILGSRSLPLRLLATLVSAVFLSAIVVIHACNPAFYDVLYPSCSWPGLPASSHSVPAKPATFSWWPSLRASVFPR